MSTLKDSVKHLLDLLPARLRNDDSEAHYKVIGFADPARWYLNRKHATDLNLQNEIGREKYWNNVARYTVLRNRLKIILDRLQDSGTSVIALKGALLGETLYESPGLRTMNDLDLLIRPKDVSIVMKILAQIGWEPLRDRVDTKPRQVNAWRQFNPGASDHASEAVFYDYKGYLIDIHWHLIPYFWLRYLYQADMKEVWDRAVPLTNPNLRGAYSLSAVHNLAYLCLHLAQHGLQPLRSLLDIDQFVRKCDAFPDWCWERFIACVQKWRMRSAAFHVLYFSRSLFGTPISKHIMERLNPGLAARLRVSALIRPRDLLVYPPSTLGVSYPSLVKAVLADRIADILKLLAAVAVPDTRWRKQRYAADVPLAHHWRHVWNVVIRGD